ncbi:MAG: DNA polymerase ligase N-terminal domain-containing protein [Dehalococcoidales bacterium]|nr:DNA polymerase ligase N-terminal domain-containing protein [Dehalococcoidales bacterium]
MKLDEYKSKRDFSKTREPDGSGTKESPQQFQFVIQKHDASHLHYDFRLEIDGVLKSWAVPKGVPLESNIKRLAVQTEDHPLDYINFEGEIPKGQYGAGTVHIVDSGNFTLHSHDLKKIEFELAGSTYFGKYVLIHTSENNWLMFRKKEA